MQQQKGRKGGKSKSSNNPPRKKLKAVKSRLLPVIAPTILRKTSNNMPRLIRRISARRGHASV